ncbi:MAG: hypothetical protein GEV08_15145 [Acidimicrobiia bacterium]|nr:hypothetical protein [Acidimicrobiia bacterium]
MARRIRYDHLGGPLAQVNAPPAVAPSVARRFDVDSTRRTSPGGADGSELAVRLVLAGSERFAVGEGPSDSGRWPPAAAAGPSTAGEGGASCRPSTRPNRYTRGSNVLSSGEGVGRQSHAFAFDGHGSRDRCGGGERVKLVDAVTEVVSPVVASLGVELVDVEHLGGVVRLVVDEPGGIGLDRVAEVTRAASRALDLADPLPGTYTLEVSSPGLERPLRSPAHFARAVGQKVNVRARPSFEGDRRVTGTLMAAEAEQLVVRTDAGDVAVPYDEVDRARTVFDWGPPPKPGKVGSRPKAKPAAGGKREDGHEGQADR